MESATGCAICDQFAQMVRSREAELAQLREALRVAVQTIRVAKTLAAVCYPLSDECLAMRKELESAESNPILSRMLKETT